MVDGPAQGGPVPVDPEEPQLTSPIGPDGIDTGLPKDIGVRLFGEGSIKNRRLRGRANARVQP